MCLGGSIARIMSRMRANRSGSMSSMATPPASAENRFGLRATRTTSAWRRTAQNPGSLSMSCHSTGFVRRSSISASWGTPSRKVSGFARSTVTGTSSTESSRLHHSDGWTISSDTYDPARQFG